MKSTTQVKIVFFIIVIVLAILAESSKLHSSLKRAKSERKATSQKSTAQARTATETRKGLSVAKASNKSLSKSKQQYSAFSANIPAGCVRLWTQCHFEGETIDVCDDDVSDYAKRWGSGKTIKSLVVSYTKKIDTTFVYFYDTGFKGDSWSVDNVVTCFNESRPIRSSYLVKAGCAVLYRECDYTDKIGAVLSCDPLSSMTAQSFPDRALNSIVGSPNSSIDLFDGANFAGNKVTVNTYSPCLESLNFSGKTSSIKVNVPALKQDALLNLKFDNGTTKFTYSNADNKAYYFSTKQQLSPEFNVNIRLNKSSDGAYICFGVADAAVNANGFIGNQTSLLAICGDRVIYERSVVRSSLAELPIVDGQVITIIGKSGVITYLVDGVPSDYYYDMKNSSLFLTFAVTYNDDEIEILTAPVVPKFARITSNQVFHNGSKKFTYNNSIDSVNCITLLNMLPPVFEIKFRFNVITYPELAYNCFALTNRFMKNVLYKLYYGRQSFGICNDGNFGRTTYDETKLPNTSSAGFAAGDVITLRGKNRMITYLVQGKSNSFSFTTPSDRTNLMICLYPKDEIEFVN